MSRAGFAVVTGAYSYTGKYIARRLLSAGRPVRTLTGHPNRPDPFEGRVPATPLRFDDPDALAHAMEGADTLFNTYWVRFPRGDATFERAVANTGVLFRAAEAAGVRRVVHVSITGASADSPLPYFRGKGEVERALASSALSHAIIRPTVVFGAEDILVNNIAWFLRRFPVFTVFGRGDYRVQPVFVDDLARLAVEAGTRTENEALDAAGPDVFTFDEMVRLVADSLGRRARLAHVPPRLGWLLAGAVGLAVGDVVVTRDEVAGLMRGLLVAGGPPTGETRLAGWLAENAASVGARYASELRRHYR